MGTALVLAAHRDLAEVVAVALEDGAGLAAAKPCDRPDVVVLDLGTPEAHVALRRLRAGRRTRGVPVVGLSDPLGEVRFGAVSGCDATVRKPFGYRELVDTVRGVCRAGRRAGGVPATPVP